MKKRSKKAAETRKAKLDKNKALAKEYGVKMSYWRYDGRKGIYWSLVSEYVRKRDMLLYGACISCGNPFTEVKEVQAGHYAPAGNCGFGLLFDLDNIHAECPRCNNPHISPGKLIQYRTNLVKRYGEDWVKKLDERYNKKVMMKEWYAAEYHEKILEMQEKIKSLDEEISKRKKWNSR